MRKATWKSKIYRNKSKDGDSNFLVMFLRVLKSEKEKECLTDVGHNSWWHMKYAQHAAYNTKFEQGQQ